jgi:Uma2 family endonuclease
MNIPLNKVLTVPPLRNGDRLTRDEFERRYHTMPRDIRAELIDGVVYMPSPTRWASHGGPHGDIAGWLAVYRANTPGTDAGTNATIRLDLDNEPQPDAALIVLPDNGGRVKLDDEDYVAGSPDLVVEVSASTVSIDLHRKLDSYQKNGVGEYIVWRTEDAAVDWFFFRGTRFERLSPESDGLFKSPAFPGLWLDVEALVQRDLATVLVTLNRGLASPEHAAFVARLAAAAAPR